MTFSYNWLQSFFSKKLPSPKKLAELLTLYAFEVEDVKKIGRDFILDIDVLPNRASDCFSHIGIAEEISAILNYKLKTEYRFAGTQSSSPSKIKENKNSKVKDFVSVQIRHKFSCPRYTARVVNDVKVGPSPKWLQERLEVCGLRPINNIVDITNYVMLEIGQPLHTFDIEKLDGANLKKIIVRFARKGEQIVTLDEQKFNLNEDILVIADSKKPIAIAGIKGGKSPEIDKKTKTIVLESANFNPQTIRQGSKKLKLKTDASLRFEQGIDPNLTETAINRTAYLIQEIAGGKICQGLVDVYPAKVLPKTIRLDLGYAERLLGVKIPALEIKSILKRLGFRLVYPKNQLLEVKIPTYRLDINIPEDLIEEIGRIYGYEKIKPIFPATYLAPPKRNLDIFWENAVKNILKEAGFTEIYNYSFFGDNEKKLFNYKEQELIELENPLSQEQKYLRASLIPNLLKNIQKNQVNFGGIKIFELGKIFEKKNKEERLFSGIMTGDAFLEAKGTIDVLLNKLGISDIFYDEYRTAAEESQISWWHPKKCAEIKVSGERIGFLGEISPRILDGYKIKSKVIYFDIFFEKLSELSSEEYECRPISIYPAAVRDIAVLVPRDVRVEEILNKIETAGGSLLCDTDLFDIYEGEELPEGKKNLAFHIIFRSDEKTLSSKEIDELQNKIIKTLEGTPEWQVRK